MTETPRPSTPHGLKKRGRKLWRDVTSAYQLRPDELILLESAAKTVDIIADLEAASVGQPLTTTGSMGQAREHPLLSEARQQRAQVARLLAQLKLPDGGTAINKNRAAAQSRWARAHGSHERGVADA